MARVAAKAGKVFGKLIGKVQKAWRTGHQAAAKAATNFMQAYRAELGTMQAVETERDREKAKDKELKKLMKKERKLLEGGAFSKGVEMQAYRELWDQNIAMTYAMRGNQRNYSKAERRQLKDTIKEYKRLAQLKSVLIRKLTIMREEFANTMAVLRGVEMMEIETQKELPAEKRELGAKGI